MAKTLKYFNVEAAQVSEDARCTPRSAVVLVACREWLRSQKYMEDDWPGIREARHKEPETHHSKCYM